VWSYSAFVAHHLQDILNGIDKKNLDAGIIDLGSSSLLHFSGRNEEKGNNWKHEISMNNIDCYWNSICEFCRGGAK